MPWRRTNNRVLAALLLVICAPGCATDPSRAEATGDPAIQKAAPATFPSFSPIPFASGRVTAGIGCTRLARHGIFDPQATGPNPPRALALKPVNRNVRPQAKGANSATTRRPDLRAVAASIPSVTAASRPTMNRTSPPILNRLDQLLILDVEVNGVRRGTTLLLADDAGQMYATAQTLNTWGVKPPYPAAVEHAGRRFHEFSAIPGVTVAMESASMSAEVVIPPEHMSETTLSLGAEDSPAPVSDTGAFVDYQAAYTDDGGADAKLFASAFQPTMFTPRGTLNSGLLYRWSQYDRLDFQNPDDPTDYDNTIDDGWIRLDTAWTRDDPDRIRTFRIGDTTTPQSSWARSVRFGGLQLATNFATRPSLVTFPRPSFSGSSAVPTALDLYVNGNLRSRENLPDGTFRIDDIPVVTGAGEIEVVTRDLLGREQVITQDFYTSEQLLRPGLSEYALNAGFLRKNFALKSNDYGDPYASAMLRRGISADLTLDGRLETTDEVVVAGVGGAFIISTLGTMSASLAYSAGDDDGVLWRIGHEYRGRKYRFNGQVQGTGNGFTQPGLEVESGLPRIQALLSSGVNLGAFGSFGMGFVTESFHGDDQDRTVFSLNYGRTLPRRIAFAFSASYVEQDGSDIQASVRFHKPIGSRRSATASLNLSDDNNTLRLDYRHDRPAGPGYGYRLTSYSGDAEGVETEASLNTATASYRGQVRRRDGDYGWRGEMSGSLAWLDGEAYANREIRNGFAVIDTGGYPGVGVFLENRKIGVTDDRGRLLVPNLRPYQANQLHIASADLPMNARTSSYNAVIAPYYRSGVLVDLGVRPAEAAVLRVVDANGVAITEGARASIDGTPGQFPVGLDGRLYLEGLGERSLIQIRDAGALCEFELPRPDTGEALPDLGEFVCEGPAR